VNQQPDGFPEPQWVPVGTPADAQEPVNVQEAASGPAPKYGPGAGAPIESDAAGAAPLPGQSEEKPKKKKRHGFRNFLIVLLILLLLLVGAAAVYLFVMVSYVDVSSYVTTTYSGYDGYGTGEVNFDKEGFIAGNPDPVMSKLGIKDEWLSKIGASRKDKLEAISTELEKAFMADGVIPNNGSLKNGDTYTYQISPIEQETFKSSYKINLSLPLEEQTVSGLSAVDAVDPFDFVTVAFEGVDEYGTVTATPKEGAPYAFTYAFSADSAQQNLKNGDTVTLELVLDKTEEELARDNGINLTGTTKEYTVEGLAALTEFDPFEWITVEFSGVDGEGKATADIMVVSGMQVLTDLELEKTEFEGLKNGDKITVSFKTDNAQEIAEKYQMKLSQTSKEYTVEGLGTYVTSLEELTDAAKTPLINQMKTAMQSSFETLQQERLNMTYAGNLDFEYLCSYLEKAKDTSTLMIVYRVKVQEEGHTPDYFIAYGEMTEAVLMPDGTITVSETKVLGDDVNANGWPFKGAADFAAFESGYLTELNAKVTAGEMELLTGVNAAAMKEKDEALSVDKTATLKTVAGTYQLYALGNSPLAELARTYKITEEEVAKVWTLTLKEDGTLTLAQSAVLGAVNATGTWSVKDGLVTITLKDVTVAAGKNPMTYIDGRLEGTFVNDTQVVILEKTK